MTGAPTPPPLRMPRQGQKETVFLGLSRWNLGSPCSLACSSASPEYQHRPCFLGSEGVTRRLACCHGSSQLCASRDEAADSRK